MSKFIIAVGGKPNIYGYHRREFKWSEAHKKFIYLGRELEESEFNAHAEKALDRYHDLNPRVVLIPSAPAVAETAAPVEPPPAPVATIFAGEITLEMAEEVIMRLAPDRLKKKPGMKPIQSVA